MIIITLVTITHIFMSYACAIQIKLQGTHRVHISTKLHCLHPDRNFKFHLCPESQIVYLYIFVVIVAKKCTEWSTTYNAVLDKSLVGRFGVAIVSFVAWMKLLYVQPSYYWDGWPSSGRYTTLACNQANQINLALHPSGVTKSSTSFNQLGIMSYCLIPFCTKVPVAVKACCTLLYSIYLYLYN